MLASFVLETFTPLVRTQFRVQAAPELTVEMILTEASSPTPAGNPFSLLFAGPHEPVLPQSTYAFEHAALGRFDLFICPVSRDSATTVYQAVFNRLPEASRD